MQVLLLSPVSPGPGPCPCHAISYFSWPPRAQKCNYSCICIPASPIPFPPNRSICPFPCIAFRLKRSQSSPPSARFSLYMFLTVRALLQSVNSGDPQARFPSSELPLLFSLPAGPFFFFRIQFLFSILSSTLVFLTLPLHCSLIGFLFLFLIFRSRSPWACLTEAEINHHELDPSSKIDHDTYLIAPGVSHFDSEPGFPHPSHLIRSTPTHLQVTHP